ncbi:uncharacterized protein LOC126366401, partial [Pectinophora gossypiella]|uniref:uncharacterized protein LOC126366401 n=1 Tax=Pectinophora gossypiella TaxID=13191 RepID=UPI00214ED25E
MENEVIDTLAEGERVIGHYAEIYLPDDYCDYKPTVDSEEEHEPTTSKGPIVEATKDEWTSPSDLLIGKVDLLPPFTSKITRGYTHKGILEIGEAVLERERAKFLKHIAELLSYNDSAWTHIQEQEKLIVAQKVRGIYEKIFDMKSTHMQQEISKFYEESLQELEDHLKTEVRTVLISAHCNIINDLNQEIKEKLHNERQVLEKVLRKKFDCEIRKMNKYYRLLLHNEKHRSNMLINQAIRERNEAMRSFCKQVENDTTTSTMYVMCTERKKCRMRQFLLENFHSKEIEEKIKTIKERQDVLDEFERNKKHIMDINKEWEEKVQKILQLFLKFISFSLKLLPEQTTFLLDLEKLVVLQLNEIHKHPKEKGPYILINNDDVKNLFQFQPQKDDESVCKGEPFVIEGDLAPSIPTPYGSRETIPPHVDLPMVRLQRKFVYAKCQRMEDVKTYLEAQRCKCHDKPDDEQSFVTDSRTSTPMPSPTPDVTPVSSNELLLVEDFQRLHHCPKRGCTDMINKLSFPNLDEYVDFNEENLLRVEAILGKPAALEPTPEMFNPKDIVFRDLPFAATKEKHRDAETQYYADSVEDLRDVIGYPCPCTGDLPIKPVKKPSIGPEIQKIDDKELNKILADRKNSLKMMLHANPKLLKLFSEENFDF